MIRARLFQPRRYSAFLLCPAFLLPFLALIAPAAAAEATAMPAEGALDAYVSPDTFGDDAGVITLCRAGASDLYFALSLGRPELPEELNAALARIREEDRCYNRQLYDRFVRSGRASVFLSGAADAGGLPPVGDDIEAWRKSVRKDCRFLIEESYEDILMYEYKRAQKAGISGGKAEA